MLNLKVISFIIIFIIITPIQINFRNSNLTIKSNYSHTAMNYYPPIYPSLTPQNFNGESVAIVVENNIWTIPTIQNAVIQYRQDLNDTGYQTFLYTNLINNVTQLRQILSNYY